MNTIRCICCGESVEVPDELWGDGALSGEPYYCDACEPSANDDYLFDDEDDLWNDCGIHYTDGAYYCGAVGSEQCDECPNNVQLGRRRWYTPKRVVIDGDREG